MTSLANSPDRLLQSVANDSPSTIRSALSAERWNELHEGKRVLIIDDNSGTAHLTQDALEHLYGFVESETNAQRAIDLIVEKASMGTPYDVIVLDLYMPQMPGTAVIKNLAQCRALPAVVINSASMMDSVAAEIGRHLDRYEAQCTFDSKRAPESPIYRGTLVHSKMDGLRDLVDLIDLALLRHAQDPLITEAAWRDFAPLSFESNFTAELVHNFCEHMRNFGCEVGVLWERLAQDPEVRATNWWNKNADPAAVALTAVRELQFTRVLGDDPNQTRTRIHDALNQFSRAQLDTPGAKPLDGELGRLAHLTSQWREIFDRYRKILDVMYRGFQEYHSDSFSPQEFAKTLANPLGMDQFSSPRPDDDPPVISDPGRILRGFLHDLSNAVIQFEKRNEPCVNPSASFVPECYRRFDSDERRTQLAPLNCGSYFTIQLQFPSKVGKIDDLMAPVAAQLPALIASKRLLVKTSNWGDREHVELDLKVADPTIDFEAEFRKNAEKKADGTRTLFFNGVGEFAVHEDLGIQKNIVVLGDLPTALSEHSKPVLYQHEGKIICAESSEHYRACALIAAYLRFLSLESDLEQEYDAREIYRVCARARSTCNGEIDIEARTNEERAWVVAALCELGVNQEDIFTGQFWFGDRPK